MINAWSVLNGYTIIRGSFNVHMAMFISMLIFMSPYYGDNIPTMAEFNWAMPGGELWIHYGLWMHLLLAVMQFWQVAVDTSLESLRFMLQIMSIIAQVVNFCLLSRLYANSPPMATFDQNEPAGVNLASFESWLFVEAFMVIFTFVALIIFLFIRTFHRGNFHLEMGGGDPNSDFLACEETELTMTLFAIKISFVGTNLCMLFSSTIPTFAEEQMGHLTIQFVIQCIELLTLILATQLYPSDSKEGKTRETILTINNYCWYTAFIFGPIASVAVYGIFY